MLDILKHLKNNETKDINDRNHTKNINGRNNIDHTLPLFSEDNKNITIHNKYNYIQNKKENSLLYKGKQGSSVTDITLFGKKSGKPRHFPPATKEWVNSTYSYNKNLIKTLPVADDIVNKLIKGYLNMDLLVNNKKSKSVDVRQKRLSLNNILLSKAEMKHSSNKVIVTIYLYNRNKKFFLYKLINLYKANDLTSNTRLNKGKVRGKLKGKILNLNPKYTTGLGLETNYLKRKVKFISLRAVKLIKKINKHKALLLNTLSWDNSKLLTYKNIYYKNFIKNAYEIELLYMYYTKMLSLNNNKFKNWFLLGLKKTVSKLYNKKIEFNFVSLKYLHLNSDIFTESIVTRLRNRDNSLLAVLNKALRLAKIPSINYNVPRNIKDNIPVSLYNKYKSYPFITNIAFEKKELNILSSLGNGSKPALRKNHNNDVLDLLLNNIFMPSHKTGKRVLSNNKIFKTKVLNIKQSKVLDTIKYKTVWGVRLEAAGRLSKRLTASRSVFKLRYKGGLKNVYSSKRAISSVMLRGNANSNVQYTLINSKTRNGSFGLKGWVSGY